ncbi:MAG: hypothetical protein IPL74_17710 [Bacteroidetes bacterium]|nr:hypothetical protein [Bacteroidota bacterium]
MVRGLKKFKEYFKDFDGHYVIIGGTACDIIIEEAGFKPRATKDIDIVLIVESLSADFSKRLWQFINDGEYQQRQKSEGSKEFYRFLLPENSEFPQQIELFARKPDLIILESDAHLTPIPLNDDLSSLSAILIDEDYYQYVISNSFIEDGVRVAKIDTLICLKALAFLEIIERKEKGFQIDEKLIRKHKTDVFRLTAMLTPGSIFELPKIIQSHVNQFADLVSGDLPDKAIFKEIGLNNIDPNAIFEQFKKSFKVSKNEV